MGTPAPAEIRSFDEFFAEVLPTLLALGTVLTGDRAEAHDLAQETLVRAWQRWPRIGAYDDPAAWARHVLTNLATSRWRSAWRRRVIRTGGDPDLRASSDPDVAQRIAVAAALRALPARHRAAVVLHDAIRMTVPDVARDLDVPEGTVKSWIHRGREALARELRVEDGNHRDGKEA